MPAIWSESVQLVNDQEMNSGIDDDHQPMNLMTMNVHCSVAVQRVNDY